MRWFRNRTTGVLEAWPDTDPGKLAEMVRSEGPSHLRTHEEVTSEIGGGGGGGSTPALCGFQAAVYNGLAGYDSDGGPIVFDSVQWDTDGFWQSNHTDAVIPAGKGGVYQINQFFYIDDDTGLTYVQMIVSSGTPDDQYNGFDANYLKAVGPQPGWNGDHTHIGRYADGDTINIFPSWTFPGGPATLHIPSGSYLTMVRLGDLP